MKIDEVKKEIAADIPLATPGGKIRVKERSCVFDYGTPFPARSRALHQRNYVEWQISYDLLASKSPSVPGIVFVSNKGDKKCLFELSLILYHLRRWGFIGKDCLGALTEFLGTLGKDDLIDRHDACQIRRTHPIEQNINGMNFSRMRLEYPQLVYKFRQYEIIAEVTVREKQRAVGVQPMLYFCFPISELRSHSDPLLGRIAHPKESADFVFNQNNSHVVLEMTKIFGMLSEPHNADIVAILQAIEKG